MALQEEQIVRFSRQILLREVGGAGQLRLLAARAEARGQGPALTTALAYVSAGGSQTAGPDRALLPAERGFLQAWPAAPQGGESGAPETWIQGPGVVAEGGFRIWVGGVGEEGAIVFASDRSCVDCVQRQVAVLTKIQEALADLVGAIAALLHQRRVLGLAGGPSASKAQDRDRDRDQEQGVIHVRRSGETSVRPLEPCEACR